MPRHPGREVGRVVASVTCSSCCSCRGCEGLVEIVDDVLDVFDAHANPHHAGKHARVDELLLGELGVGVDAGWMMSLGSPMLARWEARFTDSMSCWPTARPPFTSKLNTEPGPFRRYFSARS